MKKIIPFIFLLFIAFAGCKKSTTNGDTDTSEIDINEPEVNNSADYVYIANQTTVATAAARANLAQFGDFDTVNAGTFWSDADINAALIAIIKLHYTPTAGVKYKVIYFSYNGQSVSTVKFFHLSGGILVSI